MSKKEKKTEQIKKLLEKSSKPLELQQIYDAIEGTNASIRGSVNLMVKKGAINRVSKGTYWKQETN